MLATANPGTAQTAPTTKAEETRPVRLLVPTVRRSDYYLPPEDTLRASDLGITRHTTDTELEAIVAEFSQTEFVGYRQNLSRLRDALRHPRDIAEARAWGYEVPITANENKEEVDHRPNKRLGWWWVYDRTRTETRHQREARYLADTRYVDMRGFARIACRAYITIKDRKFEADNIRKVLNNTDNYRTDLANMIAEENPAVTAEQAEAMLLEKANRDILKALPPRNDRAGQSDLWLVSAVVPASRKLGFIDQWSEYAKIRQTGRPVGAKTRKRHTKATTE